LKFSQDGEVCDESSRLGSDLVPDGIELVPDENVERAEEGVLDGEVLDFELGRRPANLVSFSSMKKARVARPT
jgi:hypothetical protein